MKYIAFTNIFSGGSLYFINIVTFVMGIAFVSLGMINIGSFIAIIGFVDLVALPTRDMIYLIITINSSSKVIDKLDFYLNGEDEIYGEPIKDFELIEIKNLSYSINDFSISNINMNFEKGKKYAIIGENGSGKSTIMKILANKYENKDGQIYLDGVDINAYDTRELLIYLSNLFLINDSILENIKLSNPSAIPSNETLQIVDHIKNKDVQGLSMGERARVNIARAINSYKEILILDEFFANIDARSEVELTKLLLATDKTIILVTHNNDKDYLELFDKVYSL